MKKTAILLLAVMVLFSACGAEGARSTQRPLPAPEADANSPFGVDKNINMSTIDNYLGREDTVYRDVRMLFDPADYAAIGGEADLSRTIRGFKIVPYPFVATLGSLPVAGAYSGNTLFEAEWNPDGSLESACANYAESMLILEELFPRDKHIFLMCGGGGYAGMMKSLLVYLGWDSRKIYNIGGNWEYKGSNTLELIIYPDFAEDENIYATWRADYAFIDFDRLHPEGGK